MSQTPEKKNRFQQSREAQEEFVNGVAETMLSLAERAGEWKKPWISDTPMGTPYCPTTGREYGGANMVKLMLTTINKGYEDDRWLTYKQFLKFREDNPDLTMDIPKGEKGITLLRPEEIVFTVSEEGRWKFLGQEDIKELEAQKAQGQKTPDIQRRTLFYPFTVFNARQIEGFPQKEKQVPAMSAVERNEFLEKFIASSGVSVEHHDGELCFDHVEDVVKMPFPERFTDPDEYYAIKLHEYYHATGHESRENRRIKQSETLKGYAFDEMRSELFSVLAGAKFNLSMPENNASAHIANWNRTFSGGDAKAVFQAATEAARALTTMRQFEVGEQPSARWFPKKDAWPELIAMQAQRNAATPGSPVLKEYREWVELNAKSLLKEKAYAADDEWLQANREWSDGKLSDEDHNAAKEKNTRVWDTAKDKASQTFESMTGTPLKDRDCFTAWEQYLHAAADEGHSAAYATLGSAAFAALKEQKEEKAQADVKPQTPAETFLATDDPVTQAHQILRNPDFLEMALKLDPEFVRDLASLCDSMSQSLHMELDERLHPQSRLNADGYGGDIPVGTTTVYPSQDEQTAPARRMRM